MDDNYNAVKTFNQNFDQTSLDKYIEEGLNDINHLNNILSLKTFEDLKKEATLLFKKYSSNYEDRIELSFLEDDAFLQSHYLLSLKSFFDFLMIEICEIIMGLLDLYNDNFYPIENNKKEKIMKDFLIKILNKFAIFKAYTEYFKYLDNSKGIVQNLKLPKKNLSYKEKAYYLSCILTIILMSPKNEINNNIDFFEIKDNGNDIYSQVKKFIFSIIDKLNTKSAYINGLELITSRIKEDLNEENDIYYENDTIKNTFILEMKSIEELKQTIKNFFPKIIVRTFNSQSGFNAHIDNYSGLMIINEHFYEEDSLEKILGNYDDKKAFNNLDKIIRGLIDLKNDHNYKIYNLYIFKAFWRINH